MNVIDKSRKLFVGIVESKSRSEFSAKYSIFFFLDSKMEEPKFDILSELVNNPGLKHIGEKICYLLDLKTLFSCRLVQHSWNDFLNYPRFWLKRLSQIR